ncbi:MAG: hypothetical protein KGI54_10490 [Pseudomonadota bacterium]|nr:hypothetical protein [Pseudomonadota bacterium]
MTDVSQVHEEKETLVVDINIPGHDPRVTTPLFRKSRQHLIEREGGRCHVCGRTAEESGHPLEAHHFPIERSMAEMIDWSPGSQIRKDFPNFGWGSFDENNPYSFVDDMNVNGLLLCKAHHTGKDEGIHDMPHPLWVAQKYGKEGYKFSDVEIIHHEQE